MNHVEQSGDEVRSGEADEVRFSQGEHKRGQGIRFSQVQGGRGEGEDAGYVEATSLIGKMVRLGDKDGGIWDRTRVVDVDERRNALVLEGGVHQPLDGEPETLSTRVKLPVKDITLGSVTREDLAEQ